ncbi:MAG: HNH endonuclease [Nitrospinota bacterium]
MGAKDRIRDFFEANLGKIVKTQQIRTVARISEYARRIRELRDEEGMQIKSHHDRHDLKPGQYILETLDRISVVGRGISPQLRNEIFERNGYTCQNCGAGPGDPDPFNLNRKIRLHIDHIKPKSQGGTDDKQNLRVLCSACNQGKSNIQPPSETALNILARIRRIPRSVRREVYEALKKSLGE